MSGAAVALPAAGFTAPLTRAGPDGAASSRGNLAEAGAGASGSAERRAADDGAGRGLAPSALTMTLL
ncbi:Hypothetical predicted protein [Podarcis lilfordi]|uniref:Uncharacterized protein n=1 Tax=Podarcis lilfordi TaxID=74358 RepID=A0AA35L0M1_9SAUR|nr:Hypothetical predicted protein [Podarcis lilfordi]